MKLFVNGRAKANDGDSEFVPCIWGVLRIVSPYFSMFGYVRSLVSCGIIPMVAVFEKSAELLSLQILC